MTLHAFFSTMGPFLRGARSVVEVERTLGLSRSGTAALDFYRVLVARNDAKILREICPSLHTLARRAGRWQELVRDYVAAHPPCGGDPNRAADALPEYLRSRADVDPLWSELADYHVARVQAHHAPEGDRDDDGFDRRLFVRQYMHPVPAIVDALARGQDVTLPQPRPTIVVVFRDTRTLRVRRLAPSAAGLAALARREGLGLPPPLSGLPSAVIDAAERGLERDGVLVRRTHFEEDADD